MQFFRSRPILTRFFLLSVVVFLLVFVQLLPRYFSASVDKTNVISLATSSFAVNTDSRITVQYSSKGVPSIAASTKTAQYFALGYLHTNDRLWQMELLRRQASGSLSEVFGAKYVPIDRFSLALDFYSVATMQLARMTPEARRELQSYCDGVNQWLSSQSSLSFPFEYYDVNPQSWTLEDSVAIFLLDQFRRSNGLFHVLGAWSQQHSLPLAQTWLQSASVDNDFIQPDAASAQAPIFFSRLSLNTSLLTDLYDQTSADLHVYFAPQEGNVFVEKATSSNRLTRWYFVDFVSDNGLEQISGATLPGVPQFLIGESEHLVWAVLPATQSGTTVSVQQLTAGQSDQYWQDGEPQRFKHHQQLLKVRRASPQLLYDPLPEQPVDLRYHSDGPLISDHIDGLSVPVVLSSQWLNTRSELAGALLTPWLQLPNANSAEQVRQNFAASGLSEQRLLVIDKGSDTASQPKILAVSSHNKSAWQLSPFAGDSKGKSWRSSARKLVSTLPDSTLKSQLVAELSGEKSLSPPMQALLFAWQQELKRQFLASALPASSVDSSAYQWLYSRGLSWWTRVYQVQEQSCQSTSVDTENINGERAELCALSREQAFDSAVAMLTAQAGDELQQWGEWLVDYPQTQKALSLPAAEFIYSPQRAISSDILFANNSQSFSTLHGSTLQRTSEFQWHSQVNNKEKAEFSGVSFLSLPQSERLIESLPEAPTELANQHVSLSTKYRVQ